MILTHSVRRRLNLFAFRQYNTAMNICQEVKCIFITGIQKKRPLDRSFLFWWTRRESSATALPCIRMARRPNALHSVPVSPLFAKNNSLNCFLNAQTLSGSTPVYIKEKTAIKRSSFWWTRRESNPRPLQCECSTLPTELRARMIPIYNSTLISNNQEVLSAI